MVVDDGSGDDTADVARRPYDVDVTVIVHEVNQGLGAAMRTGIGYVLDHAADDDLMIALDADNTHPPELMPGMVAKADNDLPDLGNQRGILGVGL